jgi:hypothetical protein
MAGIFERGALSIAIVASVVAFGPIVSLAGADDWARDGVAASAVATDGLDPAIRTAISAKAKATTPTPVTIPTVSAIDDGGFAWRAAGAGAVAGMLMTLLVVAAVGVGRHHGRIRSA